MNPTIALLGYCGLSQALGIINIMFLLRLFLSWLAILALAIINGAFRELFLVPNIGYPWALLLSGFILASCVVFVAWFSYHSVGSLNARTALGVGLIWLLLTLIFEFSFGRYVQHKSWVVILGAYTFERGNLWPVILIIILLSPSAVRHIYSNDKHTKNCDA